MDQELAGSSTDSSGKWLPIQRYWSIVIQTRNSGSVMWGESSFSSNSHGNEVLVCWPTQTPRQSTRLSRRAKVFGFSLSGTVANAVHLLCLISWLCTKRDQCKVLFTVRQWVTTRGCWGDEDCVASLHSLMQVSGSSQGLWSHHAELGSLIDA